MKFYAALLLVFLGISLFSIGQNVNFIPQDLLLSGDVLDFAQSLSRKASGLFNPADTDALTPVEDENNFYLDQQTVEKIIDKRFYSREQSIAPGTYTLTVTGYSSTIGQCDADPFTTASGQRVRDGIVAANFLPLGTHLKIPSVFGDKVFEVQDRMAGRHWSRIDVWFANYYQALAFGVRRLEVEILPE